jgi:hypothetical protein
MRTMQQRIAAAKQPTTAPLSLPAPVKGWNTRDELDSMDPLDAILLDNFYPDSSGINCRTGSIGYAVGLGSGPVETLAEFDSGSVSRLLGACGGSIFDISNAGPAGPPLGTGFSNARWQTTTFLQRLFLANGADPLQIYDGGSLAAASFTGAPLSSLVGVFQYQQTLFLWANNSTGFYFAQLNSISGALSFYDLSPFSPRGGNLVAMTTVTHDGGNGVLDFAAFILSSGDMLLFYGNDPAQSAAWQMIGRYRVAAPVNIRAVCQYGADSFVTTNDDYLPLQQQLTALQEGTLPPRSKASGALQAAILANGAAFGWQSLYYPKGRRLIFNVPNADGTFSQHVQNTSLPTQPWCRFNGWNASCFGLYKNNLFFGGPGGAVYQGDIGYTDVAGAVTATAQQAWNKIDSAYRKRMSAMRPIVNTNQSAYNFRVGFDYGALDIPGPVAMPGPPLTDDAGVAITDSFGVPITIGAYGIFPGWHVAGDTGTAFSFGMTVLSFGQTSWLRTDFRLEQGFAL